MAVSQTFYYVGPPSQVTKTVQPLLRLLGVSVEVERIVLAYLLVISRAQPVRLTLRLQRNLIGVLESNCTILHPFSRQSIRYPPHKISQITPSDLRRFW